MCGSGIIERHPEKTNIVVYQLARKPPANEESFVFEKILALFPENG